MNRSTAWLDRVAVVGRHDETGNISGFFELGDLASAAEDFRQKRD